MNKHILTFCLTLLLYFIVLIEQPVVSADFDKGLAAHDRGDYATAVREFKPLAEQGDAKVQNLLGSIYSVLQDYKMALKWYRKAAEQGNTSGQSSLAWMYFGGKGVPQDSPRAHMWFNISASLGYKIGGQLMNIVATKMTAAQIAAAQKLARECVKKKYKGC